MSLIIKSTGSGVYTRPVISEQKSPLLRLPTELRFQICSYMSLSPDTVEWNGAFFSCRLLHNDMINELRPAREMQRFLQAETMRISLEPQAVQPELADCPHKLSYGLPSPLFGWIRNVTVHVPVVNGWLDTMHNVYPLYLDELRLILVKSKEQGNRGIRLPYHDLKSANPPYLLDEFRPAEITVNCKKITMTLDVPANPRRKKISYELQVPHAEVTYLFTIVQTKKRQQVERSYTFKDRFTLPAYDPYNLTGV
ncbi:hypothetical protein C7974DRAFT_387765 [Boeremia exigua]|uniref:uncharacterized protein n=1 Tax=Boeremia exigua TaxID=749465 RepID=UPI001E8E141C|nr:uncharacterized protein C7974DRAFT_387765 [Boeremia exigua]KAH6639050.1 hypothetical protein C7974DRAFT_387765 [Boeremia exigua]